MFTCFKKITPSLTVPKGVKIINNNKYPSSDVAERVFIEAKCEIQEYL